MEYCVKIKEMPNELRPRERLMAQGVSVLSDRELIAILLRTGSYRGSALDLATTILSELGGVKELAASCVDDLKQINGVGPAKATQLLAAVELGKRIASTSVTERPVIRMPQDASDLVMEEMRHLDREHFRILILNTKHQVMAIETISVGSLNASIVHPREVFKNVIRKSGAAIILVHNHPSGDPQPSKEDLDVTKRLANAGKLLGIEILDHLVIGDNKFYSLKEHGLFD